MSLPLELRRDAEALIARRLGLRLPQDRQADLERALLDGIRSSPRSPDGYLGWLAELPDGSSEWGRLASRLTVGETYFFRDRACFEALEQDVLPGLIEARRSEGTRRLRIWSAGCATGEEAYSLAILLDRLIPDRADWALTLVATDINPDALVSAERGLYREWSFRETPSWLRERYFHRREAEASELDLGIRRMVTFAPLNLARDGYPSVVTNTSGMDLVLCRNALMYFAPETQRETMGRLRRALVPGGWLVLSPAEASAELLQPLIPVNFPDAVFFRKERLFDVPLQPSVPAGMPPPEQVELPPFEPARIETPETPAGGAIESAAEPVPAAPLLQQARGLADQGRLEDARRLCEAALARDPLAPEGHFLLAAICQELGDLGAALEGLRRVLYLAPDSAPAHFLLGALLLRGGSRRRGRRALQAAIGLLESAPNDAPVEGGGGLTAGRLKETARAYLAEG